jgi:peptide/nickel transport system substrate-binding protein
MVDQSREVQTGMTMIQAQLKKVGIDLRITIVEYSMYRQALERGDQPLSFGGSSPYLDPALSYGGQLKCGDPLRRATNFSGYCDPAMDALLERAETELDPARRREFVRQMVAKHNEEVPLLPIVFVPRFFAMRDYVKGFTTESEGPYRWSEGGLNYTWLDK